MIRSITAQDSAELQKFLKGAGSSLSSFRYFSSRDLNILDNHIVTLLYYSCERGKVNPSGYAHLDKEGNIIWLGICVTEECKGQGIGTLLMEELVKIADEKQLSLRLSVDSDNLLAIKLYKKFGFKVYEEHAQTTFMNRE